jgi:lysophospholipase L1-like esterase
MLFTFVCSLSFFPILSHADTTGSALIVVGDSVDWGYDGGSNSPTVAIGTQTGWANDYLNYLKSHGILTSDASLIIIAVPGATTLDINQSQLDQAINQIRAYSNKPLVVTYGGGGNDLINFIFSKEGKATCLTNDNVNCLTRINALLSNANSQINLALKKIRSNLTPGQKLLVRTYQVPQLASQCSNVPFPGALNLALISFEGTGGFGPINPGFTLSGGVLSDGLNDILRKSASKYNAAVVDIFPGFFPPQVDNLIGLDCTHPNTNGYDVVSTIFSQTPLP